MHANNPPHQPPSRMARGSRPAAPAARNTEYPKYVYCQSRSNPKLPKVVQSAEEEAALDAKLWGPLPLPEIER